MACAEFAQHFEDAIATFIGKVLGISITGVQLIGIKEGSLVVNFLVIYNSSNVKSSYLIPRLSKGLVSNEDSLAELRIIRSKRPIVTCK